MSTESELKALSNSQLASGAEIPATKHRTVNDAIIEELFDAQSRGDVLSGVQAALAIASGDKVLVIRSGAAFLLDADEFGFISNLVDLDDVNIPSPANNQIVNWNSSTGKFIASDLSTLAGATFPTVENQSLGTNPTTADAEGSSIFTIQDSTFTASTTLTISNVGSLSSFTMELTNTNANVITFAGITLDFGSELPTGVTFAANALTFPNDSAVDYLIKSLSFDGTTFYCILINMDIGIGGGGGGISGSGTINLIPKFTGGTSVGDSSISDDGVSVSTTLQLTAEKFIGDGREVTNDVISLGTNPTTYDLLSKTKARFTATYTATNTLTFSNSSNLEEIELEINNTNANVITFSGITLDFGSALPTGVTFAANALTFPADSAVDYLLKSLSFDGTTLYCILVNMSIGISGGGGGASAFTDLTDTFASYAGLANELVKVNAGETGLETNPVAIVDLDGVVSKTTFIELNDTPISYTGRSKEIVNVNLGETALETSAVEEIGFTEVGLGSVTPDTIFRISYGGEVYEFNVQKI